MEIRPYTAADAAPTLAVFLEAVTVTAAADYSPAQVEAWARRDDRDVDTWHAARVATHTYVAEYDGAVAGFADIDGAGHIGMLYVAPAYGRRGVATALLHRLLRDAAAAGVDEVTTEASLTARPFFERHGFLVTARQRVRAGDVELVNFRMSLRP